MPLGKKYGGRKKGTPNKPIKDLHEKARELKVDIFEILCLFAKGDFEALGYDSSVYIKESKDGGSTTLGYVISPETRLHATKEAAKYLYPQLKAIEHSGEMTVKPGIDIIDCSASGKIIKLGKENEN